MTTFLLALADCQMLPSAAGLAASTLPGQHLLSLGQVADRLCSYE